MPPIETIYARIMDAYHISIPEISLLTDRQIYNLYYHPRNKNGEILMPEQPTPKDTFESEWAKIQGSGLFDQAGLEAAAVKLRAKYGREPGSPGAKSGTEESNRLLQGFRQLLARGGTTDNPSQPAS